MSASASAMEDCLPEPETLVDGLPCLLADHPATPVCLWLVSQFSHGEAGILCQLCAHHCQTWSRVTVSCPERKDVFVCHACSGPLSERGRFTPGLVDRLATWMHKRWTLDAARWRVGQGKGPVTPREASPWVQ